MALLQRLLRISDRHWLCVRRDPAGYFWCDSKDEEPQRVAGDELEERIGAMMRVEGEAQPQVIQIFRRDQQ